MPVTGAGRAPLRIAAVQCCPVTGDVAGNATDHAAWIGSAAAAGARVVVFPQLSLTGYDPDLIDLHQLRVLPGDPRLAVLAEACRQHQVHAFFGAPVAEPRPQAVGGKLAAQGPPRVGVLHAEPSGRLRVAYLQRFLATGEIGIFGPGQGDAVVSVDGWRLALASGRDCTVPEHATRLAYGGADAYLAGGFFPLGAEARLEAALSGAAAGGLWTVLAQFCGGTGGGPACGGSGAWAPGGTRVAEVGTEPGIAMVEITAAGAAGVVSS
jgi:predicted amidohydrolase